VQFSHQVIGCGKEFDPMMSNRVLAALVAFGCIFAIDPANCRAVPLTELVAGQVLTAHDKIFSNWQIISVVTEGGGVVSTGQIDVTPLIDDPLNPGVKFTMPSGAFGLPVTHLGAALAEIELGFTVRTASGLPLIKDNSLLINGFTFDAGPGASIQIFETVTDSAGGILGNKHAEARPGEIPGGSPNHFDSADFAPHSLVQVRKLIYVEGPGMNDRGFLTMFEQRFSQVPEPGGLALALIAASYALVRRSGRGRTRICDLLHVKDPGKQGVFDVSLGVH
jgi:hypothetical protein